MMKVKISPIVLIKIVDTASRRLDREVGGFLIGKIEDNYLNIVDVEIPHSRGSKTFVEMDPLDMAVIAEKLDKEGKGESIVGWWHSHPGFGADFMSDLDINTQKVYQALFDKAVALIIDPKSYISEKDLRKIDLRIYRVTGEKYKEMDWDFAVDDMWRVVEDGVKLVSEIRQEKVKADDLMKKVMNVSEFKEEIIRLRMAIEDFTEIKRDFIRLQTSVETFMMYSTLLFLLFFVFVVLLFLSLM